MCISMDYLTLQMMNKGHEEIKQKVRYVSGSMDPLSSAGIRVSTKILRAMQLLIVAGLK